MAGYLYNRGTRETNRVSKDDVQFLLAFIEEHCFDFTKAELLQVNRIRGQMGMKEIPVCPRCGGDKFICNAEGTPVKGCPECFGYGTAAR